MTTQSEQHEALVEEIGKRICHWQQGGLLCTYPNCDCGNWKWRAASEILALILSRLGDVTPEMVEAVAKAMAADEGWGWDNPETLRDWWIDQARAAISAFLAVSALTPGEPKAIQSSTCPALCEDCPPVGYVTNKTRCALCPRRAPLTPGEKGEG